MATQTPVHNGCSIRVCIERCWAPYLWADQQLFVLGTGTWCSLTGQNFTQNMAPATIDFAGVHIWPDLWTVSLMLLSVHVSAVAAFAVVCSGTQLL